jgi:hypothetical protein
MDQVDIDRKRARVFDDLAPAEELAMRVLNAGDGLLVALVSAPRADWPRVKRSVERHFGRDTLIKYQE